jgi:hypothetical protein
MILNVRSKKSKIDKNESEKKKKREKQMNKED